MLRHTIAVALTLTLTPGCDDRHEDHDDTDAVDSETEGEDTDGASETGAGSEGSESGESDDSDDSDDSSWSTTGDPPPSDSQGSATPLVLAFRGEAVHFNTAVTASFDLTGTMSVVTDWPTSTTPWLALDRNGNNQIDDGGELFGSATLLPSGEAAANGFIALAELDSNSDGRIDAGDPMWSRLLVWSDVDGDRKSTANELSTASMRDLVAIELEYSVDRRCDARGNCEVERAAFVYLDGGGRELHGAVVDVHLRLR